MSENELLAYLAGIMDADGYFSIKRTAITYLRNGQVLQPGFSEGAGLNQVTNEVINLLRDRYGGTVMHYAARSRGARPIYRWRVGDRKAAVLAKELLPWLRIKHRHAEILLELRAHKELPQRETREAIGTRQFTHWTGRVLTARKLGLSQAALAYREQLWTELRDLHDVKDRQTMLFHLEP